MAFFKPENFSSRKVDLGYLSAPDPIPIDHETSVNHPRWAQHPKVSQKLEKLIHKKFDRQIYYKSSNFSPETRTKDKAV